MKATNTLTVPLRAAIYVRRSKRPKGAADFRSVTEQRDECAAVVDREGWDLVDTYQDNDLSASAYATAKRPDWGRLKTDLVSGRIDVLVTYESSRAQRDLRAYVELRDLCQTHGVLWSYGGTTYDLTDDQDKFRTGLDALLSEQETDRSSKRIRRSVRANAAAGRPHGKRIFGYDRSYDPETGALIGQHPNPGEAALVREAAERFLNGEATGAICRDWNTRGIPAPRPTTASTKARNAAREAGVDDAELPALVPAEWRVSQIKRLLTNPAYLAIRIHKGEEHPADWDPILTVDQRARLLARFNDPRRLASAGPRTVKYLLTGIARCGKCGQPLGKLTNRGRATYSCRPSGHLVRDMATLDAYVTSIVLDRLAQPDLVEALTAASNDPEAERATSEAEQLRERLDDVVDQFTEGSLTAATLAKVEAKLLPAIAAAEKRARRTVLPPIIDDVAGDGVDERWDTLTVVQRREIISTLVDVVVLPVGKGSRIFKPEAVRVEWRID